MQETKINHKEWYIPVAFILCSGWLCWHFPFFTLDFLTPEDPSLLDQLSAQMMRNDVTPNLPGLFGGYADIVDWAALIGMPVLFILGIMTVERARMETELWRPVDRFTVFIGRVTMVLISLLTSVMIYEVLLRYVIEAPTLWANELSLWMAGFVFLFSGLYAMQQRSHIRIFIIYDVLPRFLQRTCDVLSTTLIVIFAFSLCYGGYGESFTKFYTWETFGTAFDPPIPATLKPAILVAVALVALQAVLNLVSDWNIEPVKHTAADDIDKEELEAIKRSVGSN